VAQHARAGVTGSRLLVLGAGPAQLGLLAAARELGCYVIAADRDPGAPGFRFSDRRAIVSAEDEPALGQLAEAEEVDGVIAPGIDWPVAIAARIAHRLGLPHPLTPETAAVATSKVKQRERFREADVPQVEWATCRSEEEASAAAERLGYPVVVKAPDRQGQRGLGLVLGPEDLRAAVDEALRVSRSSVAIVEQYAPGRELTVNAFSHRGRFVPLTVTDREVADPPAFGVALAHVWPSMLEPSEIGAAVDAARSAAAALEIVDGPTYTQILATPAGPRVVELAARLGGGHDADLCRAALGVDLNALALAAAFGEEIEPAALVPHSRARGACVRFLVAPPGALEQVRGIDEAAGLDGIELVLVYREPGFVFTPLRRGSDRAGAILAVGDSREDALARAAAASELVRFEIADAEALV
jgi:biotin carboxylase